ncbi:MAG: SufBD protein [Angelakisella sp.]
MLDIQSLVNGLMNSDDKYAYECLKQLEDESKRCSDVYPFFETFAEMLDSTNSYIRTRGIILIAANAKWDVDYRIDEIINQYLKHILDDKPIAVRQCIKMLPTLVRYKPDLKDCVVNALHNANPLRYKESMQGLILKDIQASLEAIEASHSVKFIYYSGGLL